MKTVYLSMMAATIVVILLWAATRPMSQSEAMSILTQTGTVNKTSDAMVITIDKQPLEIELEAVARLIKKSNLPVILLTE